MGIMNRMQALCASTVT